MGQEGHDEARGPRRAPEAKCARRGMRAKTSKRAFGQEVTGAYDLRAKKAQRAKSAQRA